MTLTIDLPDLVGARIQETPEALDRAKALLTREFTGIDLDAVAALKESFREEGADLELDEVFTQAENRVRSRSTSK